MEDSRSDLTRRKFIGASLGCLASAGLVGVSPTKILAEETTESKAGEIVYRTLGRTGIKLPVVSMGAGAANDPGIVQASYKLGVRHFDTAANYQFGRNEQMVGNAIARLGVRDQVIYGTKVMTPAQRRDVTPEQVKKRLFQSIEGCLRRLKTDYLDIVYIHDVRDAAPIKDQAMMDGMAELKKQGKILHTGVSTHANMAEVINETVSGGFHDVVLTSFNFTMADDTAMMGAVKNAAAKGIGIVAMKTQAGGANFPNPQTRTEFSNSVINRAALKWVARNKNVATSIPGFSNYEHMNEDFSVASNLEYTDEERKFLSDNNIRLSIGFCRQCRQCLASCEHGTDIPNLMRTHMYAAQYADFYLARTTLNEIRSDQSLVNCVSCSDCSAICANRVDIARRIEELKLMYA